MLAQVVLTQEAVLGKVTQESVISRVKVGDVASSPDALRDALNEKLQQLSSAERAELIPVMAEYHDLFRYDRSGMLPCTKASMTLKLGMLCR
jgi:hypothetical protein